VRSELRACLRRVLSLALNLHGEFGGASCLLIFLMLERVNRQADVDSVVPGLGDVLEPGGGGGDGVGVEDARGLREVLSLAGLERLEADLSSRGITVDMLGRMDKYST
jgi:hypothetical protein